MKKNGLDFIKYENPDVICLQEIKCSKDKLPNEVKESTKARKVGSQLRQRHHSKADLSTF